MSEGLNPGPTEYAIKAGPKQGRKSKALAVIETNRYVELQRTVAYFRTEADYELFCRAIEGKAFLTQPENQPKGKDDA